MSYTLESERDSVIAPNNSNIVLPIAPPTAKSPRNLVEVNEVNVDQKGLATIGKIEEFQKLSPRGHSRAKDSQEEEEIAIRKSMSK
jgi:hypothetical protein